MSYMDKVRLSLADVAAGEVIPFPLFPIGNWKSAKYPNLPLTRELADELIANFEAGVLGTDPVLDSSGKHDTSSPAAGWFKRLHIEPTDDGGEMLFGDAKLTDLGAELLNGELYRYGSLEIDGVVDNRTGEKTPNVLKSATLTNTPVLRIMPSVLDAADHIAVALSEITESNDISVQGSDPAPTAVSEPVSHDAKGDEGGSHELSEVDDPQKGAGMDPTILKALRLSEGADEAAVSAAVVALAERAEAGEAAVIELAEVKKASRAAAVEVKLSELITGGHIAPGQKDAWLKLADAAPEQFDAMAEAAKASKVIDLGEHGAPVAGEGEEKTPDVELSEKAAAKVAAGKAADFGTAQTLVLSEEPDLKSRYMSFTLSGRDI